LKALIFVALALFVCHGVSAQTITGAWKGKIGSLKTELKLIKKGDSLVGTSYYYASRTSYRRYSVKGYFDPETNSVIWWDDVLLEDKGRLSSLYNHKEPFLSIADFNCPGEDKMLLEGKTSEKEDKEKSQGPVQMQKISAASFTDEWDFVIENYTAGANHPDFIDSVNLIALSPSTIPEGFEDFINPVVVKTAPVKMEEPVKIKPSVTVPVNRETASSVKTIEEKFIARTNKLQTVIPVTSEKIELRFYDNAQIDGDSIALFLNGKMLFKNIRLTDQPYTVHLNKSDLLDDNSLVMVAENLGSIPPNTSFMVAIVGNKRYEARLYANENSSALIRFIKQP
jgi:hypothetical protein